MYIYIKEKMGAKRPENLGDRKQGNLQGENSYSKCRKDKISRKKNFLDHKSPPPPLLEKTPLVCVLVSLWSLVRNSEIIE